MKKKLYRSATDKKIAGVCGGLAQYLNMDSTIVRLIMVALVFFAGMSLWVYIIAALIIPEEPAQDENGYKTVDYEDVNK